MRNHSVAKEDHSEHDCFVCCILTHGESGDFLWAYDEIYPLDQITSLFTADKCKSLAGKPKIFIIQVRNEFFKIKFSFINNIEIRVKACRGVQFDDGVNLQVSRDVTDSGRFKTIKIPVYADFMMAYSCMPGYVTNDCQLMDYKCNYNGSYFSWRNPIEGSWFVTHLTDVINKYHQKEDLLSMMTIVNQRVAYVNTSKSTNPEYHDKKQVPCLTHTLTRKVLFAPKDSQTGPKSTYL